MILEMIPREYWPQLKAELMAVELPDPQAEAEHSAQERRERIAAEYSQAIHAADLRRAAKRRESERYQAQQKQYREARRKEGRD